MINSIPCAKIGLWSRPPLLSLSGQGTGVQSLLLPREEIRRRAAEHDKETLPCCGANPTKDVLRFRHNLLAKSPHRPSRWSSVAT